VCELGGCHAAQLVVDDRKQVIRGPFIAVFDCLEYARDLVHPFPTAQRIAAWT
jgi:hypothetical protein